jgi:trehalose 6-phosphate synthase/phosphatase
VCALSAFQAKELLDHLEGVLSNKPVEIVGSNQAVEIKPQVRADDV